MATDYSNTPFQRSISPSPLSVAITAADTDLVNGPCRGIYIGVAGNLTIKDRGGNTVLFVAPAIGVVHPIQAVQIKAATTATSVVAIY